MVLVFSWSSQNLPDFSQLILLSDLKAMQQLACWSASLTMAYQRARAGRLLGWRRHGRLSLTSRDHSEHAIAKDESTLQLHFLPFVGYFSPRRAKNNLQKKQSTITFHALVGHE